MHESVVFKTLEIRKQRTVIPERWETHYVGPTIAPAYCLKRVPSLPRWLPPREEVLKWSPADFLS